MKTTGHGSSWLRIACSGGIRIWRGRDYPRGDRQPAGLMAPSSGYQRQVSLPVIALIMRRASMSPTAGLKYARRRPSLRLTVRIVGKPAKRRKRRCTMVCRGSGRWWLTTPLADPHLRHHAAWLAQPEVVPPPRNRSAPDRPPVPPPPRNRSVRPGRGGRAARQQGLRVHLPGRPRWCCDGQDLAFGRY
jgi:hypothetical protein